MTRRAIRLLLSASWLSLTLAAPAEALPVAVIGPLLGLGASGIAATVATFVVDTALTLVANLALSAVLGSGQKAATTAQAQQASQTTLQLGETPRQMIVGRAGTAGILAGLPFNHGGQYGTDYETLVCRVADHECDALEGFYVNDTYYPYVGDGPQAAFNNHLSVYWLPGVAGQTLPDYVHAPDGGNWASTSTLTGIAAVVVTYLADAPDSQTPVWPGGRPTFLFVVRGLKCYDPRLDSTVGGSGSQRYDDPTTYVWSENPIVCRYNWARGVFALGRVGQLDQLLVGRGLSDIEAPPGRLFAPANLCDESVATPTGTEPRYRVGGIITANDDYATVEGWFADAVGGYIIQPEGSVEIDPGQAKTPVFNITDDDLVSGAAVEFIDFGSKSARVNTVVPQYVAPDQKWQQTTATVQRDYGDVLADDAALSETLTLRLVPFRTQAERLGEQRRRQRRLERAAKIVLPPVGADGVAYAGIEEGDWGVWTSRLFTNNQPMTVYVQAYALGQDWRNALVLSETHSTVFGFGDHTVESPGLAFQAPPDSLALGSVTATAVIISGAGGEADPAVKFTWAVPVDPAIGAIRAEIRLPDQPATVTATLTDNVSAGTWTVTNGVGSNYAIEARLVPVAPGRHIAPSAWVSLSLGQSISSNVKMLGDRLVADAIASLDAASSAASTALSNAASALSTAISANGTAANANASVISLATTVTNNATAATAAVAAEASTRYYYDGVNESSISTVAGNLSALSATVGTVSGSVTTEAGVRAYYDNVNAYNIGVVSSTVDGHTTTLYNQQLSINGLQATWSIGIDSGGRTAGAVFNANGYFAAWNFRADYFTVSSPDNSVSAQPLVFDSGTGRLYLQSIWAHDGIFDDLTINGIKLVPNACTYPASSTAANTFGMGYGSSFLLAAIYVNLDRDGVVQADAYSGLSYTAGNQNMDWQLYIDGNLINAGGSTVFVEGFGRGGTLACGAGAHLCELYVSAHPSVEFLYGTVRACGYM